MTEQCGCKGVRFCALCESTERVKKLRVEEDSYCAFEIFVYNLAIEKLVRCSELTSSSSLEEIIQVAEGKTSGEAATMNIPGLLLIPEFLSEEEEEHLMNLINKDYGPKVNFKHKKVKTETFVGMPEYADMLLNKMRRFSEERLGNYQPFEMCNLEYEESKKSAIEMHQDDMWIWGNRLISINLLSGSVMTLANEKQKQLCFVYMPHRSLLCMADSCRYDWKHGVLSRHIRGRRIALTMREPAPEFQKGGALYEKYGKELIRLGNIRVPLDSK